jgi:hypothetical protein
MSADIAGKNRKHCASCQYLDQRHGGEVHAELLAAWTEDPAFSSVTETLERTASSPSPYPDSADDLERPSLQ